MIRSSTSGVQFWYQTASMYPSVFDNEDYTSVVNDGHYQRLHGYIEDAREKGADVIEINPANESESERTHNKMMPTVILNATEEMLVMQEEIFGPLMHLQEIPRLHHHQNIY